MVMTFLESLFSLFPSGWGELRFIRNGNVRKHWLQLPYDLKGNFLKSKVDYICDMADTGWDCYIGVNPRNEVQIASGKDNILQTCWVYVDLDHKLDGATLDMLDDCELVVSSGNGWHGYRSIPTTDIKTKVATQRYEDKMRAWALSIHPQADPVFDCTRVLRIAGTLNWKQSGNPKKVELLRPESKHTYRAKEVNMWAPYFDDPVLNQLLRLALADKLGKAEPRIMMPSGRHVDNLDSTIVGLYQGIREFEDFGIRGYRVDMALEDIPIILQYFKAQKGGQDE
jgi:hypothetical protein